MNRTLSVNRIRIIIAICTLILLSGVVVSVFWYYEYQYTLPTPKPQHYKDVSSGTKVKLPVTLTSSPGKPVLLHFFNPDCPCSRFNIAHFKSLVKRYKSEVSFAIVLMTTKHYKQKEIQEEFGLEVPVLTDNSLAVLCGVYSTPQAALIDRNGRLFFRGNYNQSRYCSDKKTEYARLAIQNLLYGKMAWEFSPLAKRAYGCRLPNCVN